MAKRNAQPGTHKARVKKMFDGRNMATRPIPIIEDTSDVRASIAAAIDTRPQGDVVNMPSGPRPNAKGVFGTGVSGSAKVRGGKYNPRGVEDNR